jgi:hypothetical protein
VEAETVVIILVVVAATLGIWFLPKRKRWNDDGADDARRQAVARDVTPDSELDASPPVDEPVEER